MFWLPDYLQQLVFFLHVNFDVTFDIKLETVFFTFKIQI